MYNIIIVGAGGFGREVYQWCLFDQGGHTVKGFLAQNQNELNGFDIDAEILGHEKDYIIQENDRFIMAIGNVNIKEKVAKELKSKGAEFLTLIHPTAIISENSTIGEGVVICPHVIVTDSVSIDDFAMLNIYSSCGHDAKVGAYCILSPYATLNGGAVLEDKVFMATHSMVAGSKRVGSGSIIGAESLVLHDVPRNTKVLGISKKQEV